MKYKITHHENDIVVTFKREELQKFLASAGIGHSLSTNIKDFSLKLIKDLQAASHYYYNWEACHNEYQSEVNDFSTYLSNAWNHFCEGRYENAWASYKSAIEIGKTFKEEDAIPALMHIADLETKMNTRDSAAFAHLQRATQAQDFNPEKKPVYASINFKHWFDKGIESFKDAEVWAQTAIKYLTSLGEDSLMDTFESKDSHKIIEWIEKTGVDNSNLARIISIKTEREWLERVMYFLYEKILRKKIKVHQIDTALNTRVKIREAFRRLEGGGEHFPDFMQ